jgi:hypothetical protein
MRLAEGIEIHTLTAPARVIGPRAVVGLECLRTELGPPDASGRRRPVPKRRFRIRDRLRCRHPGHRPADRPRLGDGRPKRRPQTTARGSIAVKISPVTMQTSPCRTCLPPATPSADRPPSSRRWPPGTGRWRRSTAFFREQGFIRSPAEDQNGGVIRNPSEDWEEVSRIRHAGRQDACANPRICHLEKRPNGRVCRGGS